jgi:hypothetical protein
VIDRSRLEIRLGDYAVAPAAALEDGSILPRVQEYRRLAGSRMAALDRRDIRSRLASGEFHVSLKVDGEFTALLFSGGRALTVNPGGTVRTGLPFLSEAAAMLSKAGIQRALVAGELHVRRPDGKRPRIHDVIHATGRPSSAADLENLRFAVFDLIEIDGKPPSAGFGETWKTIRKIFDGGDRVRPVDAASAKTADEIERLFERWVEKEGGEGLVVRSDSAGIFKVKPRQSIDGCVVGFTEGVDDRRGMLHDMLVALMRDDGSFHLFARVGGGFSDDERRGFLSDLKDMAVSSDYAEVNPDHVAYQMVRPEWVVEVSCLDLVSQTTRGGTIDRMVLNWNAPQAKYEPIRRLPLSSALSPNFVRRREDKTVRPEDLRLSQISERVDIPLVDRSAREMVLPKSDLMRREVYTKVLKGQTMVRKLVLWKTNKERDPQYPAYVVHFTDFSPNRKTPLEREVRVSSSREQIEALWKTLAEENIVKGWIKA